MHRTPLGLAAFIVIGFMAGMFGLGAVIGLLLFAGIRILLKGLGI